MFVKNFFLDLNGHAVFADYADTTSQNTSNTKYVNDWNRFLDSWYLFLESL